MDFPDWLAPVQDSVKWENGWYRVAVMVMDLSWVKHDGESSQIEINSTIVHNHHCYPILVMFSYLYVYE